MNRMLIAGFLCAVVGTSGVVHARGVDLQDDVLDALLMTDTQVSSEGPNQSVGDTPAPATYADRAMSLGGGGSDIAAPASVSPPASNHDTADAPESPPTPPAPRTSAWRALLPGSIQ